MGIMYRKRRVLAVLVISLTIIVAGFLQSGAPRDASQPEKTEIASNPAESQTLAATQLELLAVKGRAPKTGYERALFGSGWRESGGCSTRDLVLARDLDQTVIEECEVQSGTLDDPYTGKTILFQRGPETSDDVQIDHVVALSDAWQKGAQQLSPEAREDFANDPLELLAVDGPANQKKGDGDAATWLPANKDYRCRYVSRQIAVKKKYNLWVTSAEKGAIKNVLGKCPKQLLPAVR